MSKHDTTLRKLFQEPTLARIEWRAIESCFRHLGAGIREGRGSRVRISLGGQTHVFHRPHPEKEADKGCVEQARRFLSDTGHIP